MTPEQTPSGPFQSDAYRELFEHSTDPMTMIVGDRFIDCNAAAVRMLGVGSREDVLRMHPSEISPPTQSDGRDSFEKANEMLAKALERGSWRFEWDHMRSDGTPFPAEVLLTVLELDGQTVVHAIWRDLAERKALEDQLRHALKMEAIGKLAGDVAHDFNNLLVVVQGHADLLSRRLAADPGAQEHLGRIKEAGNRAASLVQQLLAFGRKQEIQARILDLNERVLESTRLLKPLLSDNIELEVTTAAAPVLVKADSGQLEQVLMNVATNARDAMPDGGHLAIDISTQQLEARPVEPGAASEPTPHGVITITDTGVGMPEETRKRAFDPFYTTKKVGEGTGLGLATVYGIVTQNGGDVRLRSEPGRGTSVAIQLPISHETQTTARRPGPELPNPDGHETILVVEDEPVVSELVELVLVARGYTVLMTSDGAEALERFRSHPDQVSLILTDVMMPRMSGIDLVKALAAEGHNPAVLFMSGYTNNSLPQLAQLEGRVDLLKKPFEVDELARRVRAAIDRTTARGPAPR